MRYTQRQGVMAGGLSWRSPTFLTMCGPATRWTGEAAQRGVSAYFPGGVVPMLPEILSNELCSLKTGVDRLCLACEMDIDPGGNLKSSRFFRAIMRSAARLTYSGVHAAVEKGDAKARRELGPLLGPVENLYEAWRSLTLARSRRGALDLDLPETLVRLGANGKVAALQQSERHDAHRVIEELMIAANVATARFFSRARMPALYRVHAPPDADSIEELRNLFAGVGSSLSDAVSRSPNEINAALRRLQRHPAYENGGCRHAAMYAAGLLPAGQHRPLRTFPKELFALHFTDTPIPRLDGASRHQVPSGRWQGRGSPTARRRAGQGRHFLFGAGATGGGCDALRRQDLQAALPVRMPGRHVRGCGLAWNRQRPVG